MARSNQKAIAMPTRQYWPEDDARVLAQAKQIAADSKRHKAAVKAAGKIAADRIQDVKAMKSVANRKIK